MSSRHSKVSAYRAYSSQSKKSETQNQTSKDNPERFSSARKYKSKSKRRHKERLIDSDDEVLKISKLEDSHSGIAHTSRYSSPPPNKSNRKHGSPTQSSMGFDSSRREKGFKRRKHASPSTSDDNDSSSESNHRKDWRRSSYHSDSEDGGVDARHIPDRGDKVKRPWKESSYKLSNSPNPLPLVVEMPNRNRTWNFSHTAHKQPKSLFDTNILPLKRNRKPISLLELPINSTNRQMYQPERRQHAPVYQRQMSLERSQSDNKDRRGWMQRRDNINNGREVQPKRMRFMQNVVEEETVQDIQRITACGDSKNSFVIIPSSCPTTSIQGRACITLLMGNVTILGCQLEQGCSYSVYSPDVGGLLSICAHGEPLKNEDIKENLSKHGFTDFDKKLKHISNDSIAVLLVKKLESVLCDYITSFSPYTQLFNPALSKEVVSSSERRGVTLNKAGLKIAPHEEFVVNCINMSREYQDVLDKWKMRIEEKEDTKPPVFLSCGAKNSGKSTFNRMLINSALQSGGAVAYLECDCGQTEFSPPGTIALHVITEPVLGPPFCHQKQAERMVFFGDISPNVDPSTFIECLTYVFKAFSEMTKPVPLIVNTMGWTEGLGLMLLIDTVNITTPDVVIQIESYNQASNLPAISHERVALDPGWIFNKSPAEDPKQKMEETHKHDLFLLMTLSNERGARDTGIHMKLKPVDLRNLALLSSLSLGLERSLTLTSVPPYAVPYSQLAIHVCHYSVTASELLTAVDTSVVALCVADTSQFKKDLPDMPFVFEKMPVCECLGLGIVRCVDRSKGVLYLVTTLPGCVLRRVNTLLKGSLSLPDQLILKQKSTSPLPYVDALAPSTAVTGLRQRARMPRITKRKF